MTENFDWSHSQSKPPAAEHRNYKINDKKQTNKDLCCPFACPNCQSLGGDLVKSIYKIGNILTDDLDSIFSPMNEKYNNEDHHELLTRTGQILFIAAADLLEKIDDKVGLLQKSQALLRKDLVKAGVLKAA